MVERIYMQGTGEREERREHRAAARHQGQTRCIYIGGRRTTGLVGRMLFPLPCEQGCQGLGRPSGILGFELGFASRTPRGDDGMGYRRHVLVVVVRREGVPKSGGGRCCLALCRKAIACSGHARAPLAAEKCAAATKKRLAVPQPTSTTVSAQKPQPSPAGRACSHCTPAGKARRASTCWAGGEEHLNPQKHLAARKAVAWGALSFLLGRAHARSLGNSKNGPSCPREKSKIQLSLRNWPRTSSFAAINGKRSSRRNRHRRPKPRCRKKQLQGSGSIFLSFPLVIRIIRFLFLA